MRISGTEPSSVILSQTCSIKSWKVISLNVTLNKKKLSNQTTRIQYIT